ncbi:D-amino acid aminotransferase [Campylobacter pinnipediorum subsp. caledonicus]|uniref:branched-chain-amino-acid transaminase n=1 Tax=Campylobacter pinnipediorum subsp. caledonicus TaxID=1874362 RepID=A0A1S6U7M1_9BACT|nr:D-amino-acid transaminase [Campylobacter pinnipediorum]AQW87748.1 D-amino acid aminotransferase [Campylobacter pinnipediorum subsp. caledonicus]
MDNLPEEIVFINGEYKNSNEAKVSVFDRGFIFGDGVYEVVPVINFHLVDKDDFWERFNKSLGEIDIKLPYTKEEFEKILTNIIEKNNLNEGGIYMQITRGVAPRSFEFIKDLQPTVFVFCYKTNIINHKYAKTGITLASVDDIRWKRRDIKSISLLAQCYAKNKAVQDGAFEGIMIENGFVSEGCSSSVFIIKNSTLITKALSNEILPGIRRKVLLELAEKIGLKIELRNFTLNEVYSADEVFISAATLILLPAIKVDNIKINNSKIGEYSKKLRELYAEKLIKESNK